MDKQKTGAMIRKARLERGYTQNDLGVLLGVTNKAVSRWETGESFPDMGVLEHLAEVLELKIQDIVTGEVTETIAENSLREESVLLELIRVAKLQAVEKKQRNFRFLVAAVVMVYCICYGFWELSGIGNGRRTNVFYCVSLFAVWLGIYGVTSASKERIENSQVKSNKRITVLVIVSGIYQFLLMVLTNSLILTQNAFIQGKEVVIGPLLMSQLLMVFLLNMGVVIWTILWAWKEKSIFPLAACYANLVIHLALVYTNFLHRMCSPDMFLKELFGMTLVLLAEAVLLSRLSCGKNRKQKAAEM